MELNQNVKLKVELKLISYPDRSWLSLRLTHKFSAYMKVRKAFKLKYVTSPLEQHSIKFFHTTFQDFKGIAFGKLSLNRMNWQTNK